MTDTVVSYPSPEIVVLRLETPLVVLTRNGPTIPLLFQRSGTVGRQGDKGDKGDRGNDGTDGTNGYNGTNGTNGMNATDDPGDLTLIFDNRLI